MAAPKDRAKPSHKNWLDDSNICSFVLLSSLDDATVWRVKWRVKCVNAALLVSPHGDGQYYETVGRGDLWMVANNKQGWLTVPDRPHMCNTYEIIIVLSPFSCTLLQTYEGISVKQWIHGLWNNINHVLSESHTTPLLTPTPPKHPTRCVVQTVAQTRKWRDLGGRASKKDGVQLHCVSASVSSWCTWHHFAVSYYVLHAFVVSLSGLYRFASGFLHGEGVLLLRG